MHRIQVKSVPVSQTKGRKSSKSEPEVKGENFDAVMKKKQKQTPVPAAGKLSKAGKEKSVKKPEKTGASVKMQKLSAKQLHTGKEIKNSDSGKKERENPKAISAEKKSAKENVKKLPSAVKTAVKEEKEEKKSRETEKKPEGKVTRTADNAADVQILSDSFAAERQEKSAAENSKKSGKRAEAAVKGGKVKAVKDAKEASVHKIVDLRTSAGEKHHAAENDFSGEKKAGDDKGNGSPDQGNSDQGTAVKSVTITAGRDLSFQSRFNGAVEPKGMLLNELHEKLNDKIVKQSSIVLKDGDAGEIRLILKPESLGKVRIRLQMDEHNLSGKIFVDSSAVKEVFEQNMFRLERAFSEGGFTLGSLDVSVGDKGGGSSKEDHGKVSEKTLKIIEESVPRVDEDIYSSNVIDLVV